MIIPQKTRREFLLKSIALIGVSSLGRFSVLANAIPKPKQAAFRLLYGGGIHMQAGTDLLKRVTGGERVLRFFTDEYENQQDNYFEAKGSMIKLGGRLFGRNAIVRFSQSPAKTLGADSELFVNSNAELINPEYSKKIKPFRIVEDAGFRIGVMGISFYDSRQSIPSILTKMNSTAMHLKVAQGCAYVVCLTECPGEIFPLFNLRDLAENSSYVDQFLACSRQFEKDKLYALKSKLGHQVLLNQKVSASNTLSYILQKPLGNLHYSELGSSNKS